MYIVKASNALRENGSYIQKFETEIEANNWLQKHIQKETWGRNARQAIRGQDEFDESLVLSEFEDTQEELGETVTRIIVSLKAEYTYSMEEIDINGTSEESKRERKKNVMEKVQLFKKMKSFGEEVELYFTALINERNFTSAQKDSIQQNESVLNILELLSFGRIGSAKSLVDALVADEDLFFEADLQAVSKHMEDFLSEL